MMDIHHANKVAASVKHRNKTVVLRQQANPITPASATRGGSVTEAAIAPSMPAVGPGSNSTPEITATVASESTAR